MATVNHHGPCAECGDVLKLNDYELCPKCTLVSLDVEDGESPCTLPGRWVPNGRGTLVYVEQVAS